MADRRTSTAPRRMVAHHRTAQGDRPDPTPATVRRPHPAAGRRSAPAAGRHARRRPARADRRVYPPGVGLRGPGRTHPALRVRPDDRSDRALLHGADRDDEEAPHPRQGEDLRRRRALRGPGSGTAPRAPVGDLRSDLRRLQRGICQLGRPGPRAWIAVRRSDLVVRAAVRSGTRRRRGPRPRRVDPAHRCTPVGAHGRRRAAGAPRRPGPVDVGHRQDRTRSRAPHPERNARRHRAVPADGVDRRAPRPFAIGRRDAVGAYRRPLRRTDRAPRFTGTPPQPGRRTRVERRSEHRARTDGRARRAARGLFVPALLASRTAREARPAR